MVFVVKTHLCEELPEHISGLSDGPILLVADVNTAGALGMKTLRRIEDAAGASSYIYANPPQASHRIAELLLPRLEGKALAVAVGSGTINDLVKYASHAAGIPYAVLATAPSMNGYTSPTASLLVQGHKQSFVAHAPMGLYADLDVLCAAPARMIAAGIGDTLCRMTVETDWRLAHVEGKATFVETIMGPLRLAEMELFAHTEKVAARDPEAMRLLFDALAAGGNAMRAHNSSMPASQGEHMLVHAMEPHQRSEPLHGEAVSVATLYMAELQERLLPSLGADTDWIGAHRHSVGALREALAKGGCPVTPETIGWNASTLHEIAQTAWQTRNRYTFLNLI